MTEENLKTFKSIENQLILTNKYLEKIASWISGIGTIIILQSLTVLLYSCW